MGGKRLRERCAEKGRLGLKGRPKGLLRAGDGD